MLFSKKTILVLLAAFSTSSVFSQELETWSIYSSFSTVNSVAIDNNNVIYVTTSGGIFTIEEGEIVNKFTPIDGMHRLDPSHAVFDAINSRVILTYPDGVIDILNPDNKSFQKNEDIARVDQFSSKKINDALIHLNGLYVATDFGIVIYTLEGFFVENSLLKLGSFDRGIQVNDIDISGNMIYCATAQGVAVASLDDNLLNTASWTNYSEGEGFVNSIIKEVVAFDTDVFSVSGDSVYSLDNGNWFVSDEFGDLSVNEFHKTEQELYVLSDRRIVKKDLLGDEEIINFDASTTIQTVTSAGDALQVGTSDQGLFTIDLSNTSNRTQFLPEGPYLNFFGKMNFVENTLISASTSAFPQSDPFNPVRGYYLFNEDTWSNFNIRTNEEMRLSGFGSTYSVSGTSSHYYFGSWGGGIARHNTESNEVTIFDEDNSELSGINQNRDFIVISGLSGDSDDNIWAISYDSDTPLNLQESGSDEWFHFPKASIPTDNLYFDLFVDSNNQKWITLADFNNNGKGLLILDTKNNTDSSDDEYRKLTADANNGNLPDELITSIIEDKNGEVWIGTARGIARFIFPEFIVESTNPNDFQAQWLINEDTSAISRFLLRDVNVSAMAVNEANQKWIGSVNQGLWLLNEEGSRIEKRFTTENSPLLSNNILSIAIDDETGEVFIATDLGLISYSDLAIAPFPKMDELKVFPNPFLYSKHSRIVVEGLADVTDIKILGVDGTVVRELEARSGRISWDGLDFNGNQLGSGVYFIVALEREGNEKGIGKVVIIR
ncbi:MAG: hypothetical protein JJ971_16350 [Balneolaceae bacterium]|nr:hypothetical protein [Balneolaceae bacterium]MBO6547974.1 hypothetical protein [Balneolaceae bacterium]MBO6648487.1 hypothetical protein [Balneolaceae bacterium]